MNLEVWFPQQEEVTVFLESTFSDLEEERFSEIWLFALYAARQIASTGGATASSLSGVLGTIDEQAPLVQVEQLLGDVVVTSPTQGGGRRGFTAELRPDRRGFFKLHARGFGLMGQGVGYYAPTSTLALLTWLLRRRVDDPSYQLALATAAQCIGYNGGRGEITLTSQAEVAMQAVKDGLSKTGC
jgi:hypothetical protein